MSIKYMRNLKQGLILWKKGKTIWKQKQTKLQIQCVYNYVRKSILCFLGNFMPHLVSFVRIMFKPDTFYLSQFFNACTILIFF